MIDGTHYYAKEAMNKRPPLKPLDPEYQSEYSDTRYYLDVAPVIFVEIDIDDKIQLMNQKGLELLEYQKGEVIGLNWFENFILPDEKEDVRAKYRSIEKNKVQNNAYFECHVVTKSGEIKLIAWTNTEMLDQAGNAMRTLSAGIDITSVKEMAKIVQEQRRSMWELRKKTQQYFELATVIFVALGPDGRITTINKNGARILGYVAEDDGEAQSQLVGINWFDEFVPPEIRGEVRNLFDTALTGNIGSSEFHENEVICKDGARRRILWHNTTLEDADGEVDGTLSAGIDVTEYRDAESEVRRNHLLLQTIATNFPKAYVVIIEQDYTTTFVSGGKLKQHNIDASSFIGKSVDELFVEDSATIRSSLEKSFAGKLCDFELIIDDRIHLFKTVPIYSENGEIERVLCVVEDIAELKQVEQKLRASEVFARKVLNASLSGVYIYNLSTASIIYSNPQFWKTLGYAEPIVDAWNGNSLSKLIYPDDKTKYDSHIEMLAASSQDQMIEVEIRMITKSGSPIWCLCRDLVFERDEDGRAIQLMSSFNDITAQKQAESTQIAAVIEGQEQERDRIAADLHDSVNPLLSTIKLNIESLAASCHHNTELNKQFGIASELLERTMEEIRGISNDLRPSILRDFGFQIAITDLCDKISMSEALQAEFHSLTDERFDKRTEVTLYRIAQEALNNIIKHANATKATIDLVKHSKSIVLSISDNGKGFSLPVEKLKTNGYGFHNMNSRVQAMNGFFDIDSSPGNGCIIIVEIPYDNETS